MPRLMAWAGAVLITAACGSTLTDQQLIRANGQGFANRPAVGTGAAAGTAAGGLVAATADTAVHSETGPTMAPPMSAAGASGLAESSSTPVSNARTAAGAFAGPTPTVPAQSAAAPKPADQTGAAVTRPSGAPLPNREAVGAGAPIKLGQIGTRTGPVGAAMQSGLDATRAWVADVNARGGLAGHPVELVAADDRGDPNQALALARQMVEKDGVLALYASLQVTTVQAILPYLEATGVPIIGTCGCSGVAARSPMVFDVGASSVEGLVWEHLAAMSLTDKKKVAIFYCREASGCELIRNGVRGYQSQLGFQVVYEAQVSIAQPDFTAEVIQARREGAEVIITGVDNHSVTRIARSAHRQGYYPVLVDQHGYSEDKLLRDGGEDIEGILAATGVAEWSTAPVMADYREAMRRYNPGGVRGGPGANAWVAGIMLERLARSFPPEPTTPDVLEALYGLRHETLDGRIPPTAYRRGVGHGDTAICGVPITIKGGQFVAPKGPQTFVCAPGWQPVEP